MSLSEAWIERTKALVREFNTQTNTWLGTKEVAESAQAYVDDMERPPRKRQGASPRLPANLKQVLSRIADELSAAIDERLAAGNLEDAAVAALKAFQAGQGGEFSAFLKTISNPDSYALVARFSRKWIVQDLLIRDTEGRVVGRTPMDAREELALDISAQPGGPVREYLDALIAELRDLLDAGNS